MGQDDECIQWLQWALPQLHLRWRGFRRVRGQVCKRLRRRMVELGGLDWAAYRRFVEAHPDEWAFIDRACRITISRFYRNRGTFDRVRERLIPEILRVEKRELSFWSCGCASGEEPYTLSLIWELDFRERYPNVDLTILATDSNPDMLARAQGGTYGESSLQELPDGWREAAFDRDEGWKLRGKFRRRVQFRELDVRDLIALQDSFHIILCRNLAFTYFDPSQQTTTAEALVERLKPGGFLILGSHESLPSTVALKQVEPGIYQR